MTRSHRPKSRLLAQFGFLATFLWLATTVWFISHDWPPSLTLNEWGDTLAGFFAPLALLWLVIGYFQQGENLEINSQALEAQLNELALQVAETRKLAENSNRQSVASERATEIAANERDDRIRAEQRAARPHFFFGAKVRKGSTIVLDVQNKGGPVSQVQIRHIGGAISSSISGIGNVWEPPAAHR